MQATSREIFKAYWMHKFASAGCDLAQMLDQIQPIATAIEKLAFNPLDVIPKPKSVLDSVSNAALTTAAATGVAGGGAGYLLARMLHGVKPDEVQEIKHQELMSQYQRLTDQVARNKRTQQQREDSLAGFRGRRLM